MIRSKIVSGAVAAIFALGGAGSALAAERDGGREDQAQIASAMAAQTSLAQAILSAETETGGKAIDAGIEDEDGAMVFEVEVAKDGALHRVLVAMDTGTVIKVMAPDSEDSENGENDND